MNKGCSRGISPLLPPWFWALWGNTSTQRGMPALIPRCCTRVCVEERETELGDAKKKTPKPKCPTWWENFIMCCILRAGPVILITDDDTTSPRITIELAELQGEIVLASWWLSCTSPPASEDRTCFPTDFVFITINYSLMMLCVLSRDKKWLVGWLVPRSFCCAPTPPWHFSLGNKRWCEGPAAGKNQGAQSLYCEYPHGYQAKWRSGLHTARKRGFSTALVK